MGRIFEKRKHTMFARYARMAKGFTKIGREISIAVKQNGPNPDSNSRLRIVIQNAKAINMPKDRIDAAITRASTKGEGNFEEINYEGYGPYGVAILAECTSDNPMRTVANIRMHFSRGNGTLGKMGSLDFIFERKGVFRISSEGKNKEVLELELIEHGADEIEETENELIIYTKFADFGSMQKALEEKKITILSAEKQRIPNTLVELNEEQQKEIHELIETLEEDDDVQAVFHNMAE
ncbi:MAG: YebC/PmpR family DNA-binding transcriptional regulator [Bacteroidetes bacterium]|nr:YebC/PmpR family DNA-binding transcriptional regulator [Bacteroidota bacterium]